MQTERTRTPRKRTRPRPSTKAREVRGPSGKTDTRLLEDLGVKQILGRDEFLENTKPPILKPQWAGVVDTVGGDILATAIKSTQQDGVVTCCGNVASADLPLNVYPFILRGVRLIGIDSQNCSMAVRQIIWQKIASEWKIDWLPTITTEAPLDELSDKIDLMLQRKHIGRTIIKMTDD